MPELPEVQTVVNDLNKTIKGKTILDVLYCDNKKMFKGITFDKFKKEIKNRKIVDIKRRAKYIVLELSGEKVLIFHLKMTGHILIISNSQFPIPNFGTPSAFIKKGGWIGKNLSKELQDPKNQFVHLILELSGGKIFAFSDVRKFGIARLENRDYLSHMDSKLGLDALDPKFDLNQFEKILEGSGGKIKQILMDQGKISGIGNIYGDEILFVAGVRPDRLARKLKKGEIKKIYASIRPILEKAVKHRGSSESDFRDANGKKGDYQNHSYVYRREKVGCRNCGSEIKKIRVGQRSAHYCTKCQK